MLTAETTGLQAERLEKARRILKRRHVARVDDLAGELGVSRATIRRDLAELEARGGVRRVHGGAVFVESGLDEPVFEDKAGQAAKEKQRIAQAALKLIKPSDSVFLDGGSTVLALARLLADMKNLTVVTNSLRVANIFSSEGPRLILAGGEFRHLSQTFVGALTLPLIEKLHVDTAFMGTMALSESAGLTTTDPREAETKALVMSKARRVVLLADSSKIGKVSFVRFGGLSDVDVLITDSGADEAAIKSIRSPGTKIIQG